MTSHRPQTRTPHVAFRRGGDDLAVASDNERALLDLIRRDRTVSRADLVRATGLAAQSVMRLVDELAARGLVRLGSAVRREGPGKPSPAVELVPTYGYCVGVSVMTDGVATALVDFAGNILMQKRETVPVLTRTELVRLIRRHIHVLLHTHDIQPSRLFGIGVGITGFFVGVGNQVNPPGPLDDLALCELDELLSAELGQPVWLDNDGTAAAIGESLLGVGLWAPSFAYLYFSHGLGGGLVVDGQCVRGAHGNAGEVAGMLPMLGLERPTLEQLRTMLAEDGIELPDVYALLENFNPHWPACDRWIAQSKAALSVIVSAAFALLDPDAIVLGGRLPRPLAERLITGLSIDNLPRRGRKRPEPRIVPAEAPGDATAIGAALLPFKDCLFR